MAEEGARRKSVDAPVFERKNWPNALFPTPWRRYEILRAFFLETTLLLSTWLSQSLPTMELLLTLTFGASALLLAWICFASPIGPFLQSCKGVAPPFINISATLFALMVTFLSQDIWESNRQARRAINQEREQLLTLGALRVCLRMVAPWFLT